MNGKNLMRIVACLGGIAVIVLLFLNLNNAIKDVETDLKLEISSINNSLGKNISANRNKITLLCQCMKVLNNSLPTREGVKEILEAIEKISKISEGTFIAFSGRTVNVVPISSVREEEMAAFSYAIMTERWTSVSGEELPVSSEEKFSFLESKLSKTTWYVDVAETVRPQLRRVAGVIPSTGTIIMYQAPPRTGGLGEGWGW